jgi:hypothetical protein
MPDMMSVWPRANDHAALTTRCTAQQLENNF